MQTFYTDSFAITTRLLSSVISNTMLPLRAKQILVHLIIMSSALVTLCTLYT